MKSHISSVKKQHQYHMQLLSRQCMRSPKVRAEKLNNYSKSYELTKQITNTQEIKTKELEDLMTGFQNHFIFGFKMIDDNFYAPIRKDTAYHMINDARMPLQDVDVIVEKLKKKKFLICDDTMHATAIVVPSHTSQDAWFIDHSQAFSIQKSLLQQTNKHDISFFTLPVVNSKSHEIAYQTDRHSCRIIACKIINRLQKKDKLTDKTYFELSYSNKESKTCYPHPMVFAWSQSDSYINAYTHQYIDNMPEDFFKKQFNKDIKTPDATWKQNLKAKIQQDIENYRKNKLGKERVLQYGIKLYYKKINEA